MVYRPTSLPDTEAGERPVRSTAECSHRVSSGSPRRALVDGLRAPRLVASRCRAKTGSTDSLVAIGARRKRRAASASLDRRRASLFDLLLHVAQPILAEEDLVPDEERRCSERPPRDRTLRIRDELVLDLPGLDQREEPSGVEAGFLERRAEHV